MDEDRVLTKKEKRQIAREHRREFREKAGKTKTYKKIGLLIIGVFILVSSIFGIYKQFTVSGETAVAKLEITDADHIEGNKNAKVTLIEYSDFQCPACIMFASVVKNIVENYPEEVLVVYRHFPLLSIHKNSKNAAIAAVAAGGQGKFWEMHDILFEKQNEWEDDKDPYEKFVNYAGELGIDITRFESDYKSEDVKKKVEDDLADANNLGLNSTPTVFINGEKIRPGTFETMKQIIDKKLSDQI